MIERFTDTAIKAMQVAQTEAHRFGAVCVDTEHILLALCRNASVRSTQALQFLHTSVEMMGDAVERSLEGQEDANSDTSIRLPQTSAAKKAVANSVAESAALKDDCIDTEHVLLGLLLEPTGIVEMTFQGVGLTHEKSREALVTPQRLGS